MSDTSDVDDHGIPLTGYDLFLSYSRQNYERVEILARGLTEKGFKVQWDLDFPAGQDWNMQLYQRLMASKVTLVCWSQGASKSGVVRQEVALAHKQKKLVACMVEPCAQPTPFDKFQYEDLSDWDGSPTHENWVRLIQTIEFRTRPGNFKDRTLKLGPRRLKHISEKTFAADQPGRSAFVTMLLRLIFAIVFVGLGATAVVLLAVFGYIDLSQ
jgi:hypothetical protein